MHGAGSRVMAPGMTAMAGGVYRMRICERWFKAVLPLRPQYSDVYVLLACFCDCAQWSTGAGRQAEAAAEERPDWRHHRGRADVPPSPPPQKNLSLRIHVNCTGAVACICIATCTLATEVETGRIFPVL